MQVIYDGHIFRWQRTGGVSRYFREIISRLPSNWKPTILGADSRSSCLPIHPNLTTSGLSDVRPRRYSRSIQRHWWRRSAVREAPLFHPTYYNLNCGLEYSDFACPIVVTAHDFIGARHPKLEFESAHVLSQQARAIQHASHVVCVSKATEHDLLHFFPHMKGKTSVIYHGSSFPVSRESVAEQIFERPTFLYVGRRSTYKNFSFLLRAFARACQYDATIRLHTAGPVLTEEERWQIHFLGIDDRVDSSIAPDDSQLYQLYRQSVALLYPSRYEGFGIPPLEAMACGTLVVSSNVTSLPEVVGGAGIMLDPANEEAWTEHILQIAHQRVNRSYYITRGFERASEFTWEKSAAAHRVLYDRLTSAPRPISFSVPQVARV